MKKEKIFQKLEKIISTDLDSLQDNLILKDGEKYYVFNQFTIEKSGNNSYSVLADSGLEKNFSTLRYALSWCIATKFRYNELANSITKLDSEKIRIADDVKMRESLFTRMKNPEQREAVQTKITSKKHTLRVVENRLAKCVSLAKYYQIRGFNRDETARTRRT